LNGTELNSHLCIGRIRHVHASFSETFWHQEFFFYLDDVPHM
jgi:hypothetical protein